MEECGRVWKSVEEGLDVKINDPVDLPAPFSAARQGLPRGSSGPVAVRVGVEQRFHPRLQVQRGHRLGDPVRNRGHAEHANPLPAGLRYLDRAHRGWEVASRGHSIPELVEVPAKVPLELLDRLPVDACGPFVGLDPLIGLPKDRFGDRKRSWRARQLFLHGQLVAAHARIARPRRFAPITELPRYHGAVRHCRPRIGTLALAFPRLSESLLLGGQNALLVRVTCGVAASHVPHGSLNRARAAFTPDAAWMAGRKAPRLLPKFTLHLGFGIVRHFLDVSSSGSLAFAFPGRT